MAKTTPESADEEKQTEHVLRQPIKYYGEDKSKGDKVLLWPDQVERLREQGVIE
ncbi:hypothetical protein [Methylocaldum gracile]|jgi:hypothetical protein|uniref:hypothetical protein n=1 Tax=Methylocaldum sp. 0917 TaxID=2485163 RepID=UPI0010DF88CB